MWVWWASKPDELSARARERIELGMSDSQIYISAMSCWEIALLVRKGRLVLTTDAADWIARSEALPFLRFVPVDNRITVRSTELPGPLHDDPADRIIIATALCLGATLITRDARIRAWPYVTTLW